MVAGTGISIGASRDPETGASHPQASWTGLLESGLAWLEKHDHLKPRKVAALRTLIAEDAETHDFISTAQHVVRSMGGVGSVHYERWLRETVGTIEAHDNSALDALEALRLNGNLLATTNYDGLLLGTAGVHRPVTWRDPGEFVRVVRERETNKVLYLHGYWRDPESVILDWTSYEQIVRDTEYRDDLASVWKTTTWVYVGCGANGLSDPDFGLLLESHGRRARNADLWDYCLVRSSEREEFEARFKKLGINVCAVSFGEEHSDLPAFLQSLLPQKVEEQTAPAVPPASVPNDPDFVPAPPDFYAEPDYIGSHRFVGRVRELEELDDWARPADPTNLLLFEAIGGNGKSMLTWEWTTKRATRVRDDWAGRFWYSFYERGAVMADFCQRALAYMTGRPLKELRKKRTAELREPLLAELHANPWLLVLDGLERVLVAYHRIDAAEMRDEDADNPTDQIANRDPIDAIREEDNDLLRALAAAAPSKILVSSRLTPRVLLNSSGQPVNGAKRYTLPGLRPGDAEQLLRSCGIDGDSEAIQKYLAANCDNHPLVIGALAGLINKPGPTRSDFDAWASHPDGGMSLDLADLNLMQRRNHIIEAAYRAVSAEGQELLSTLAFISDAVDYETLAAFDPHDPPDASKLAVLVEELEERGLLQYDGRERRHDLHPVVRAVAARGFDGEDKDRLGQLVVDHFSSRSHSPYDEAESLEDVRPGLSVVSTLLRLGHFQQACDAYRGGLSDALLFNLEAHSEVLALLEQFFGEGWGTLPRDVHDVSAAYLANSAGIALSGSGNSESAALAYAASLKLRIDSQDWHSTPTNLHNVSVALVSSNRLAAALRSLDLALQLSDANGYREGVFVGRLHLFSLQSQVGLVDEAWRLWEQLDAMGREWSRRVYRAGWAELELAVAEYRQGNFDEELFDNAERLAADGRSRSVVRGTYGFRGDWYLDNSHWKQAASGYSEAVRMARERSLTDSASETGLALAKWYLGELVEPRAVAERLAMLRRPSHRRLARLWLAIGEGDQARHHALAAYKWAWADGEPYVHRFELTKTTELLEEMGVPIPELPPYDPAKDEPFPWEADVRAAIERLRAEKEAREREEGDADDEDE